MQFISDRQSLASSFAFQTQSQSSYLLSSRASRRRVVYDQSQVSAHQQIQDFKQQIQEKYKLSITNKIYTFPFNYNSLDMFDDSDFKHLQGDQQICLYSKEGQSLNKDRFKILNKKIKNTNVNNILAHLKGIKENIMGLTLYNYDSLDESNQAKPTNNVLIKKSKGKQQKPELKSGRTKINYETLQSQQESPNFSRHLYTQPYEKPLGYILKKK